MNFPRQPLIAILKRAALVAPPRPVTPVLSHVIFVGDRVVASDIEMEIAARLPTPVERCFTVSARDLLSRLSVLSGDDVSIALKESRALVTAPGSRRSFALPTTDGEGFPQPSTLFVDPVGATVPGDTLRDLLARSSYAMSQDVTRAHLAAVCLELGAEACRATATDGHRLATHAIEMKLDGQPAKAMVPAKAVPPILALLDDGPAFVASVAGALFVRTALGELTTKTAAGEAPPYDQVIPTSWATSVSVERAALLAALRAVAVASGNGGVNVRVTSKRLALSTAGVDTGEGADDVPCSIEGPECRVRLNARYVCDALTAIDDDVAQLELGGELDPVVVRGAAARPLGVVMPMRVE